MRVFQLLELPELLEADALYFILNGDYAESYLTDDNGVAKFIGNTSMIENLAAGGAATVAELTDATTYDFPTLNTPVVNALAAKANSADLGSIATFEGDQNLRTTDPATFTDLTASGTVTAGGLIKSGSVGVNGSFEMGRSSDGSTVSSFSIAGAESRFWCTNGGGSFTFFTNSGAVTEKFRIANDGNVGIGTTTPSSKLQVVSSGSFSASAQTIASFVRASSASTEAVVSITSGNTGKCRLYFGDTDAESMGRIIYDHSLNSLSFGANGINDQLTISSTGNVGIGTTTPTEKFDVAGNINVAGSGAYIRFNSGNMAVKDEGGFKLGFQTYNLTSGTRTTKMVLDTDGNVGIGTTTPAEKLDVVGNITASGTVEAAIYTRGGVAQQSVGTGDSVEFAGFESTANRNYLRNGAYLRFGGGAEIRGGGTASSNYYFRFGYSAGNDTEINSGGVNTTNLTASGTVKTGSLTVAVATASSSATAVAAGAGASVYITDETGGATLAVSDGTVWRRVSDRASIS
jgi:hypothetical protein